MSIWKEPMSWWWKSINQVCSEITTPGHCFRRVPLPKPFQRHTFKLFLPWVPIPTNIHHLAGSFSTAKMFCGNPVLWCMWKCSVTWKVLYQGLICDRVKRTLETSPWKFKDQSSRSLTSRRWPGLACN
jgi:hypothetical protein